MLFFSEKCQKWLKFNINFHATVKTVTFLGTLGLNTQSCGYFTFIPLLHEDSFSFSAVIRASKVGYIIIRQG